MCHLLSGSGADEDTSAARGLKGRHPARPARPGRPPVMRSHRLSINHDKMTAWRRIMLPSPTRSLRRGRLIDVALDGPSSTSPSNDGQKDRRTRTGKRRVGEGEGAGSHLSLVFHAVTSDKHVRCSDSACSAVVKRAGHRSGKWERVTRTRSVM